MLLGLGVRVDEGLGVGSHVLKEARYTAEALIEVLTLPKGLRNDLQRVYQ